MINALFRFWNYIVNHNVWNKVAATAIVGIGVKVYSSLKGVPFWQVVGSVINYKLPVWAFILSIITAIICTSFYVRWRNSSPNQNNTDSIDFDDDFTVRQNLVLDSNLTNKGWYDGYGVQDYTEEKGNYGEKGKGVWDFQDNILTIAKSDVAAKYVVAIRRYFYKGQPTRFVPKYLTGDNPRQFQVKFRARSLGGGHTLWVVFRPRDTFKWILGPSFSISQTDWEPFWTTVQIGADKEFLLELHSKSLIENTRFQIKSSA
jgi:hypothetical protein